MYLAALPNLIHVKKLSVLILAFGLSTALSGQTSLEKPARSLAVALAPNWEKAIRFGLLDDDILIRTGYSLGLDYFQALGASWEAKIATRYHHLNFAESIYTYQFDTIGGSIFIVPLGKKTFSVRNDVLSFTAGIRRFGKPAKLRWFWNGEVGASIFIEDVKLPAVTVGLGTGWEWTAPKKDWAVSAQPVLRCLFWGAEDNYGDHIVLALEFGLRHSIGKTRRL